MKFPLWLRDWKMKNNSTKRPEKKENKVKNRGFSNNKRKRKKAKNKKIRKTMIYSKTKKRKEKINKIMN